MKVFPFLAVAVLFLVTGCVSYPADWKPITQQKQVVTSGKSGTSKTKGFAVNEVLVGRDGQGYHSAWFSHPNVTIIQERNSSGQIVTNYVLEYYFYNGAGTHLVAKSYTLIFKSAGAIIARDAVQHF